MAKKKQIEAVDETAAAHPVTDGDGAKEHLIALWGEGDTLTYYKHHAPVAKEVLISHLPYTHVGTDEATGVWIYRNDRKN